MIHTAYQFESGEKRRIQADICVIGSGAGGASAAWRLAKSGARVVLLEAGDFLPPQVMNQREEKMLPRLFYSGGGRKTSDRAIRVLHGKGLGGSTLHNINLCKRTPSEVFNEWNISGWSAPELDALYSEVESKLGVVPVAEAQINTFNRLFRKGTEALGYRGAILHHNREGCVGSGFCELGCAFNAKKNALRVLMPEFLVAGGTVYCNARVHRLRWKRENGKARVQSALAFIRADGAALDSAGLAELEVEAREFVLAGGAIETPALLQRSDFPDPHGLVGTRLHLHPGAVAAGVFDEDVECWKGVPQSWECTEFLDFEAAGDQRAWLVGGSAHPAGMASILPGFGSEYRDSLKQAPRLAPISVMLHDITRGRVRASGDHGVRIDYRLGTDDRRVMVMGLIEAGRILFAAGAREVVIPCDAPVRVGNQNDLELARERIAAALVGGRLDLVSVHPMSTVWMSEDPTRGPVSPEGLLHSGENLRIADTSLYPTSLGVPPQITTYMAGLKVAEGLLRKA